MNFFLAIAILFIFKWWGIPILLLIALISGILESLQRVLKGGYRPATVGGKIHYTHLPDGTTIRTVSK